MFLNKEKNRYKKLIKFRIQVGVGFFLLLTFFFPTNIILAFYQDGFIDNLEVKAIVNRSEMINGKTIEAFSGDFKIIFSKTKDNPSFQNETNIDLIQLNENLPTPWNLNKISNIYQFDFKKQAIPLPFEVRISYQESSSLKEYKQIFFYDKNSRTWKPLVSSDNQDKKYVSALVNMPFARLVVLSFPGVLTSGKASWYAYKGGNFTASPDFPKGSRLRVYNLDNNKFVDVVVNDYGPERLKHPDRVVDLDKVAFSKIASVGAGVINVRVEPLEIKSDSNGLIMGVPKKGSFIEPDLSSKAAIIFRESDGEIIFEKNSDLVLPLASLTKMVAVKTFLDIGKNRERLDEVVSYKTQDENYNYAYCHPWESPRVKLNEGDKVVIKDLIYSGLAGSFNNTIETLARVSGLSRVDFVARMNENAKLWGAKKTFFVEPTGLSPKNVTTPLDYVLIVKELGQDPIISQASTIKKYTFNNVNDNKPHAIYNTNYLLDLSKYQITASKTGYLDEAGYCLMTRFKEKKESYVVVTFSAKNRNSSFYETEELMRYGVKLSNDNKVNIATVD